MKRRALIWMHWQGWPALSLPGLTKLEGLVLLHLTTKLSIIDLAVFLFALVVMLLAWVGNGLQCVVTDGL